MLRVLELSRDGEVNDRIVSREQFLSTIGEHNLPFRDLRMLMKSSPALSKARHPAILPRPSSDCFILELENIKLLCFSQKCLIINPEERTSDTFIKGLKEQLKLTEQELVKTNEESSLRLLHQKSIQYQDFEQVILETALEFVVQKYRRHLQIIKPALEMLLQQVEGNPETNCLRRLLAVKKSLAEFEQNVELVSKVLRHLLADDEDMASLSLTNVGDKESIELLLSSVSADLDEIETEIKIFIDMIEDTDQFISAHLDAVRNEIIKMSLFIEIGALTMAVGAVVSGIFGMNLSNALEESPYAFSLVLVGLVVIMIALFAGLTRKYYQLKADTTSAQSFTLLKNFFSYVDDLEYNVFNKNIEKKEFKGMVETITGLKISDKESEYLFKMVDVNRNGIVPNSRRPSFFCMNNGEMGKVDESRINISRENQAIKPFGSRLSVFSGHRELSDKIEKERLMVPA